ncbi:serine hydrolase domain-containing protein [Amorphus sp. 3PC139-8]|uniref:serine hydrolase domain-containing protein n=1 Tax=Amorphus sp. 3PC139-8 TaxID=2735676 RepID=UPI00345CABBD
MAAAFPFRLFLRWLSIGIVIMLAGAFAALAWQLPPMLAIGSGYAAKTVCSGMYVSGLDLDRVWNEDVLGRENALLGFFRVSVDDPAKRITASPFGLGLFERTAVHREGLGCALAIGISPGDLASEAIAPMKVTHPSDTPWPAGSAVPPAPSAPLAGALERAFAEPEGTNAGKLRTRAVVVVQNGELVAERYADGIQPTTPLTGWSMAKTVTGALAGIAMNESDLALDEDQLLTQWSNDASPKSRIPFSSLLGMTDGLSYNESYGAVTDTTRMLYEVGNAVDFLADMELAHEPGTRWAYSSGATVLSMGAIRHALPADQWATFPQAALFQPIGMTSAVFETDPAGTFMGSSWLYATARDWARFGQLILQKGLWEGKQVLPVGWVDTMVEPVQGSGGAFGQGQIWLQSGLPGASESAVPPDTLWMRGHDGQTVAIVPSLDLVVVRLGMTNPQGLYDRGALLTDVIDALQDAQDASPTSAN